MLLRVRVRLPDRPGSLGKVARILGAAGADVIQMAVLERDSGRALDDFTVVWPSGMSIGRLCDGLSSIPGVGIIGVWPTAEPQGAFPDAELIGQIAANPEGGLAILTDGVPAILSADWAGLLRVESSGDTPGSVVGPGVASGQDPVGVLLVHTSLRVFAGIEVPEVWPIRCRAFPGQDGTQYAIAPLGTGDLALLAARMGAPPFHHTEVARLAQLISAAVAVLGTHRLAGATPTEAV